MNIQKHVDFHIKKGALHASMHIKPGKKIPVSALMHEKAVAKKTHNVTLERRVQFALNMAH